MYLALLPYNALIYLVDNQITHLFQPIRYLPNGYKIDLTGNPLVCDAKLAWVTTSNLAVINGICSAPQCFQGTAVSRLSKYKDIGMPKNAYYNLYLFTPLLL